jgi:soluble lytic murein transglycosylase
MKFVLGDRRCYGHCMRLCWVTLCLIACACSGDDSHRQATLKPHAPPPADAPPAVPPGTPAPLTEAMAVPYFTVGPAGDGARAFALEKWQEALAGFTKARATATGADVARLELLIGLTYQRLGDWVHAADHIAAAKAGLPLIGDYIAYQLARSMYFAHRTGALAIAQGVARDSVMGAEAELLVGDMLRDAGEQQKIVDHYRDYLKRRPDGPRRSEARFRLAEALQKLGGDAKEWVALYRSIVIEDPLSSWATKSHDALVAAQKLLPTDLQAFDTLTADEHIVRGMELFDAMRNPESEAAFAAALAAPGATTNAQCVAAYHKAQSRFKARDRAGAAPMFDAAVSACTAAKNVDLWIKSLYQAGRSYAFIGQHETATDRYQAAQKVDPKHSYADDALLREGEEWASRNDGKQVEAVLSALPQRFPDGDNVAEAMWRLGWRAWRDKQYDAAIGWWQKQLQLVPRDDNYYGEGQPYYWLGRAYAAKNDPKQALQWYERCAREFPAAYYALQALNRIREADAKRYQALVAELAAQPKDFDPKAPAFTFKPRVEWGLPGFQRALEFLRLGLGDSAEAELRKLKLTAPSGKKRVDDADQIEKLWAIAFLYDRAGRKDISIWPTRWHVLDYRKTWPVGANRARWLIAYPMGYQELLARHAKLNGAAFAMQIAIVREESGFDPLLESYANAIGLTQMIPPTAKDFSKGTGIAPTRENLRDPEKNVTIGSRFLGSLYSTWKGFALLVPPSYNAGPAAVRKMLRLRGTWDADEFIEGIVDDQARNYSKRVLGTYFTYSWLYEQSVPELPLAIPKDLLPKP